MDSILPHSSDVTPGHRTETSTDHIWHRCTRDNWHFLSRAWTHTLLWPTFSAADFKTSKLLCNLKWVSLPSYLPWWLFMLCLSPGYSCGPSKAMQLCCSQSSCVRSLTTHPGSHLASWSLNQRLFMYHHSELWPMLKWLILYGSYYQVSLLEQLDQKAQVEKTIFPPPHSSN